MQRPRRLACIFNNITLAHAPGVPSVSQVHQSLSASAVFSFIDLNFHIDHKCRLLLHSQLRSRSGLPKTAPEDCFLSLSPFQDRLEPRKAVHELVYPNPYADDQ
jgi:hypothetical protein